MTSSIDHRFAYPTIRRGGRIVLHAGELALPRGAVVGLVGINGVGKSTLMMHAADVLRTSRGASRAGYAPQHALLPAWLNSDEIARLFGFTLHLLVASYPSLLLHELRGVRAAAMSVGQAQALSVALALAADAPLVILDEPFAPLDFRRRIGLAEILQRPQHDRTILVSTQSAAELVDVCSRVVVLKGGRCVWQGAVSALTGPDAGGAGEAAVRTLEKRLLSLLHDETDSVDEVSGSRRPYACHPP